MTISIVIPTRDPQQCVALISQLKAYGHDDIVVVHPTGTTPCVGARHIATPTLVSAARARNIGVGACHGAVVCLLDDDVVLLSDVPRWLAWCLQAPHIGMVGAALHDATHDGYWRRCMHRIMADTQHVQRLRAVPALVMSMAVALRRIDIQAVGGFAEEFARAAGEDSDLSLRMGYVTTPYILAQARINHDPHPDGWWAATRRLWHYGRQWPIVVRRQPQHPSPLRHAQRIWAPIIVLAAPLLALYDVRRWWRTPQYVPGCTWLRWVWYIGVAHGVWNRRD